MYPSVKKVAVAENYKYLLSSVIKKAAFVKKVAVAENYKYLLSSVIKKAAFYNMDPYLSFSLSNKLEEPDIFNTERSNG